MGRSFVSTNWKNLLNNKQQQSTEETTQPIKQQHSTTPKQHATTINSTTTLPTTPTNEPVITSILTKFVALDCEFIGIGKGGHNHQLARTTVVNSHCDVIYDKYIQLPSNVEVTDWRTHIHGITHWHLTHQRPNLTTYERCQHDIQKLLANRILVGHSLSSDLTVLQLQHPKHLIRDTSTYQPFMIKTSENPPMYRKPSLANLYKQQCQNELLHKAGTVHDSITDAKAVMRVYHTVANQWEKSIKEAQRQIDSSKKAAQLKVQLKKRRIVQQQQQDNLGWKQPEKRQKAGHT